MMPDRISSRLAGFLCLFCILLTVTAGGIGVLIELDSSYPKTEPGLDPFLSLSGVLITGFISLSFAVIGGLITMKRPGNLLTWALLLAGFGAVSGLALGGYAQLALLAKPEWNLPAGAVAAATSRGAWIPILAGIFLLAVLFPRGTHTSNLWRLVTMAILPAYALLWLATAVAPTLDEPFKAIENPLAIQGDGTPIIIAFVMGVSLVTTAVAAVALVFRFRQSAGEEREQFKWLAWAAALFVLTLPIGAIDEYEGISSLPLGMAMATLPASVGIAVLRHRLYDIDRIINRTLVYALLTAMLALVYFGLVVGLQALLNPLGGGSNLAVALTTLLVAALFLPARDGVQGAVDRRFNRRQYDAARTVDAFALRLRQQIDLDTLRGELGSVLDETMQPANASVWLRPR